MSTAKSDFARQASDFARVLDAVKSASNRCGAFNCTFGFAGKNHLALPVG